MAPAIRLALETRLPLPRRTHRSPPDIVTVTLEDVSSESRNTSRGEADERVGAVSPWLFYGGQSGMGWCRAEFITGGTHSPHRSRGPSQCR